MYDIRKSGTTVFVGWDYDLPIDLHLWDPSFSKLYNQNMTLIFVGQQEHEQSLHRWLGGLSDGELNHLNSIRVVNHRVERKPPTWPTEMPHPPVSTSIIIPDDEYAPQYEHNGTSYLWNDLRMQEDTTLREGVLSCCYEL